MPGRPECLRFYSPVHAAASTISGKSKDARCEARMLSTRKIIDTKMENSSRNSLKRVVENAKLYNTLPPEAGPKKVECLQALISDIGRWITRRPPSDTDTN